MDEWKIKIEWVTAERWSNRWDEIQVGGQSVEKIGTFGTNKQIF